MSIKLPIQKAIADAIPELGLTAEAIHIEHPADLNMGDYSTNVAMAKAKELKTNPRELAERIAGALEGKIDGIEKIEVAGPGFINFYLSKAYFNERVAEAAEQGSGYGKGGSKAGRKMMVEYTDPNPFKQFHIGHLMSNSVGESLSRIFEYEGAEVKRANYQGDVGLHVAKAIWGMRKKGGLPAEGASLSEKAAFLGDAYVLGANAYEDDPAAKAEIDELNGKVFSKSEEVREFYDWGREISLEHFEEIYAKLGTKFDFYYFEGEVAERGIELVRENVGKVFEESDGAVVFRGENHDPSLHTRVFLNSKGLPTYEAKELALAERKASAYPFDESVSITASEQSDYFRVVLKAIELINPALRSRMRHIAHGMLRFASGKMSSRKGNVITGESLISDVEGLVREKMKDRDMSESEKDEVAEAVAVAAIKYSVLKQAPGRDIVFDFDKSLSFDGDSGPYLQYAAVRAGSVLEKAKAEGVKPDASHGRDEVTPLERLLARFPEVVETAGEFLSPNYVATYLIELSAAYNSYYADHKIVDKNDPASPYRVALTKAFRIVMENGLFLLGMKVPRRM